MIEKAFVLFLIFGGITLFLMLCDWLYEGAENLLESIKDKRGGDGYQGCDVQTDESSSSSALTRSAQGATGGNAGQASVSPFSIQVRNSSKNIGDHPYPSFLIEMKGSAPGQVDGFVTVEMFLHIFDMGAEEGELPLVHSMSSDYNEGLGPAFQFQMRVHGGTYYPEWQEIENIPLFHLEFPWQGWRKLKFRLLAMGLENGQNSFRYGECVSWNPNQLYDEVNVVFSHEVAEPGYLD